MSGPKKKLPRGKQTEWVRTGGAIGDPTMKELDDYNLGGADVDDSVVTAVDGDINEYLIVQRKPGSEP